MITVRFPTGFSIQYNTGYFVRPWNDMLEIRKDSKDGVLLALVPTSCVVEWSSPCRTYQAVPAESDALLALTKEIKSLKRKLGVKP